MLLVGSQYFVFSELIFVYRQRKKSVKENKQSAMTFLLRQPIKQRHTNADSHHHKHINAYFSKCQINTRGKVFIVTQSKGICEIFFTLSASQIAISILACTFAPRGNRYHRHFSQMLFPSDQQKNSANVCMDRSSDVWVP